MKQFIGGFALATVLVGGAGVWLIKRVDDQPVRWPPPSFYDAPGSVSETGYLRASGTLVGEDMDGSTFLDVTCDGDTSVCRVSELQRFGSYRQVSLYNDEYPVTSWKADQIVAESSPPPLACNRVRMVLDRVAKVTHYYRIPNPNADREKCAKVFSKDKVFDWTLGDQPI